MNKFLSTSLNNIAWFNNLNRNGMLDMTPSFQRNPVWSTRQKSYLIDSVLNGYPIPEIYIQQNIDENGTTKYVIVDGQQRMRSVLEFIDDKFPLNKEDSPEFKGAYFKDLTVQQKKEFFAYSFVVRTLPELTEQDIREIFKRLNKNVVSLNKQELRKAVYSGPFIKLMTLISGDMFWISMRLFSPNDIKRMRDVEYISELAVSSVEGISNKKDRLERFYEESEDYFPYEKKMRYVFERVMKQLSPIVDPLAKSRWRNKTDFYTLFNALAPHAEKLPLEGAQTNHLLEMLLDFSEKVNAFMKFKSEERDDFPEYIMNYGNGVRAATDITARMARQAVLDEYLEELFV